MTKAAINQQANESQDGPQNFFCTSTFPSLFPSLPRSGTIYAMTKAAINQLAKNLACEWAKDGIRVNSIAPWYTATELANQVWKSGPYCVGKYGTGSVRGNQSSKGKACWLHSLLVLGSCLLHPTHCR